MNYDLIRRIIWITGISSAVVLNFVAGEPQIYKSPMHPVGADVVSVRTHENATGGPPVPLTKWSNSDHRFVETGQSVEVYISNSYTDHSRIPRATFFILAITLLLQFALALDKGWDSSPLVLEFRRAMLSGFICTTCGLLCWNFIPFLPMPVALVIAGLVVMPGGFFIAGELGAFTLPVAVVWTFLIDWMLICFCIVGLKRLWRRLKPS